MIIINKRYPYESLDKITLPSGVRHYICPATGSKLPSVTTILDATGGDKKELMEWKERVGEKEADRIKKEALGLGTLMHTHLEKYVMGEPRPGGNNMVRIQAERMADQIIERGFPLVNEVWGSEVQLYVPGLYAGTCDLIGIYNGQEAIMDFKTAKKIRTRQMINDYLNQVVAYGICHDELYGTSIETGVIFMVDRDFNYKEFIIEKDEYISKKKEWLDRVEKFLSL